MKQFLVMQINPETLLVYSKKGEFETVQDAMSAMSSDPDHVFAVVELPGPTQTKVWLTNLEGFLEEEVK